MSDRTAEEQARIERECAQEDLVNEAEALVWRIYYRHMAARPGSPELTRLRRIEARAEQRLFRRFGSESAYWASVAV